MEKNKMRYSLLTGVATIALIFSSSNIAARPVGSTEVPSAPAIENMQDVVFIGRDDLLGFKDLDEFDFLYEPEYISALVKEDKLFGEDVLSQFNDAYMIEMYMETTCWTATICLIN